MKERLPSPQSNRSAPRGRGFGRDDRAVSPLLGAILLFALVLALLVLVQVTAVPGWNQQVEYEHNQRVQQDMRGLEAGIEDAGQLDRPSSAVVETGVEYPSRPFLFNPTDPSGTIETDGAGEVRFRNANVTGVDTVWTDGTQNYTTQGFQYVPDYNEYANFPVTRFENGVLYNQYDDTVIALSDAGLVEGRNINVVTLDGQLSTAPGTSGTVSLEPLAGRSRPVSIQSNDGSDIVIELPTRLDQGTWETILADELQVNNPDGYVTGLSVNGGVLELQLLGADTDGPIQYQLRLGKVGINGDGEFEAPHYLALQTAPVSTIDEGETTTVTVEVRNRYNNPVQGQTVTFERTGGGVFVGESPSTDTLAVQTGADGLASVRLRASDGLTTLVVSDDLDDNGTVEPRETVTVRVTGESLSGDDDATDNDDSINPAGFRDIQLLDWSYDTDGCDSNNAKCRVIGTFRNNDVNDSRTIDAVRVNFIFVTQSSGGGGGNNNQGSSPPTYAVFETSDAQMEIRGPFDDLNATEEISIANSTTKDISMRFYDANDNPVNMDGQRYLLAFTFAFDNGRTGTYFIAND